MPFDNTVSATQLNHYNQYSPIEGLAAVAQKSKGCLRATYDFAVGGGAIGAVTLKDDFGNDAKLPDNAIITQTFIDAVTVPTSLGAATIAVSSGQGAGDIKAAAGFAGYTGLVAGLQVDGLVANMLKLTANRTLVIDIAVAALTAGKFHVMVEFVQGS